MDPRPALQTHGPPNGRPSGSFPLTDRGAVLPKWPFGHSSNPRYPEKSSVHRIEPNSPCYTDGTEGFFPLMAHDPPDSIMQALGSPPHVASMAMEVFSIDILKRQLLPHQCEETIPSLVARHRESRPALDAISPWRTSSTHASINLLQIAVPSISNIGDGSVSIVEQ